MNSNERFEQLYEKIVQENERELEELRKDALNAKTKYKFLVYSLIVSAILIFYVCILMKVDEDLLHLIMIIYIGIEIFIYNLINKKIKKGRIIEYKHTFKERVIKELLKSFNENIEYFPNDLIDTIQNNNEINDSSVNEFMNVIKNKDKKLYDDIGIEFKTYLNRSKDLVGYNDAEFERYDTYTNEDFMKGMLKNNCYFEMAEVLTEYVTTDSDGDRKYHTLFSGMFARIKTPKPFKARLYIRKNIKEQNVLAKLNTRKWPFDNLRIEMDSQEFEKVFDVYCDNKIVAMQLLTADIMQMLINFYNEIGMEYEITIKDDYLYIRFRSGKMFDANEVNKKALDKKKLYQYYEMLDFTFSLTNKLVKMINDTEY